MANILSAETIGELPCFVTHLECSSEGDLYEADQVQNLSTAGKPLLVRYDLPAVKASITKNEVEKRAATLWRYKELLPVRKAENIVSLGETITPLVTISGPNGNEILVKDEGRLPTGSFKARGLCMAVSMAKELGVETMAMPTNGNAGAALAAYCSRAGIESFVFCPDDTPEVNIREIALQGAHLWRVNGLIDDCGKIVGDGKKATGWFDVSTSHSQAFC